MLTTKEKTLLVPELLCQILSPFSPKADIENSVHILLDDEEMLDLTIELTNRHFLIPTLFNQLCAYKLDAQLDHKLKDFLIEMTEFMSERNRSLTKLTKEIIEVSNQHGIIPLLIKGSSTLFSDVYPSKGIRFMSDLDILFEEKDALNAFNILQARNFNVPDEYISRNAPAYLNSNSKAIHLPYKQHLLPIYRDGDPCGIEVHHRPLSLFFADYLDNETAFSSASDIIELTDLKLAALRMSPTNEIIYCFAHSELAHINNQNHQFSLRQMDFFVRLVHCYQTEIDWIEIHERIKKAGGEKVFHQFLYSINQLFATSFPLNNKQVITNHCEKYYNKALASCFPKYNPKWRLNLFIAELSTVLSRRHLSSSYNIDTKLSVLNARLHRIAVLIIQFSNPVTLFKRIQSYVSM